MNTKSSRKDLVEYKDTFTFRIKHQAKNVFPKDVESTVGISLNQIPHQYIWNISNYTNTHMK